MKADGRPLDAFQTRFCGDTNRNIRLLAPAGSGKTHSLLYRCADVYRRQNGSAKFLLITFTRAARDELRKRLTQPDFKDVASSIEVSTLNGWGWRRVRQVHSNPRLMTTSQDKNILSRNVLAPVISRHPDIAGAADGARTGFNDLLLETIDLCKGLAFDHEKHITEAEYGTWMEQLAEVGCGPMLELLANNLERLEIIGPEAEKRRKSIGHPFNGFMRFWCDAVGTLISQSFFTLEDQKYVAARILEAAIARKQLPVGAARYTDILVDEFQDINPLDLRLVTALVTYNSASITIVGDDDQAIYEWRGSVPDFILNPERNFKREFATHILENNYRCPANIVDASKSLIRHNKRRVDKVIRANSMVNAIVEVAMQEDFAKTIMKVTGVVKDFVSRHAGTGQRIALMSRKRAQLIPYQIIFAAEGITFCAAEDLQVFLSAAFQQVKDAIEIRATCDGRMRPRQIVEAIVKLMDKLKRYPLKRDDKAKLESYLSRINPKTMSEGIAALAKYSGPIKGMSGDAALNMCKSAALSLTSFTTSETVSDCLDCLSDSFQGFEKDYGKSKDEIFYADPPFYYLSRYAEKYGADFDSFLDDIDKAIQTLVQLPVDEDNISELWQRPVHLMTALRAKGREFDEVVLLDVNDGIWPTRQAVTQAQQEQERRVFYVALTRVKRKLWITVSARIGDDPAAPSPFLRESCILN